MLSTLLLTLTTDLCRYLFDSFYLFVCLCVFVSFNQSFHCKADASKPRSVSRKQELSKERRASQNSVSCVTKTRTVLKKENCFMKPKTVSSNWELFQINENCFIQTRTILKNENCLEKMRHVSKTRNCLKKIVGTVSKQVVGNVLKKWCKLFKKGGGNCLENSDGNCLKKAVWTI